MENVTITRGEYQSLLIKQAILENVTNVLQEKDLDELLVNAEIIVESIIEQHLEKSKI